jgi:hypothetical protein
MAALAASRALLLGEQVLDPARRVAFSTSPIPLRATRCSATIASAVLVERRAADLVDAEQLAVLEARSGGLSQHVEMPWLSLAVATCFERGPELSSILAVPPCSTARPCGRRSVLPRWPHAVALAVPHRARRYASFSAQRA